MWDIYYTRESFKDPSDLESVEKFARTATAMQPLGLAKA